MNTMALPFLPEMSHSSKLEVVSEVWASLFPVGIAQGPEVYKCIHVSAL